MPYKWNEDKNKKLLKERCVSFDDLIKKGKLLGIGINKSKNHIGQRVLHIFYDNYVYGVPFVYENEETLFLKTAFQSRKLTKEYKQKGLI